VRKYLPILSAFVAGIMFESFLASILDKAPFAPWVYMALFLLNGGFAYLSQSNLR
jgi:hypothetical protein